MHDEWTGSKGPGLTDPGAHAVPSSATEGGNVPIGVASAEIVAALQAAACARAMSIPVAQTAAFNAVRLALGAARREADSVAVTAAVWPPLPVAVSAAHVCWRSRPEAPSVAADATGAVVGDGAGAFAGAGAVEPLGAMAACGEAPEVAARGAALTPAPIIDAVTLATEAAATPVAAGSAQEAVAPPVAAAGSQDAVDAQDRASGLVRENIERTTFVDDAFSYRPGDRVVPALRGGRDAGVDDARPEPRFSSHSLSHSYSPSDPDSPDSDSDRARFGSAAPEPSVRALAGTGQATMAAMAAAAMPSAVGGAAPAATVPRGRPAEAVRGGPSLAGHVRRGLRWAGAALAIWFAAMLALIVLFRFVDPPGSTLIAWQALTGTPIERQWVPLSRISRNLQHAVIVSEDGRFCQHWGIDPREVAAAIRRARDGVPRGASTITMQLAKNLFLWPSKSYLRKVLEVPLTLALEVVWPKERILEVYLNIVEWGPGVFGAEAAARHHFNKSAQRLSQQEAALLAVSLPNPIRRDAGDPGRGTRRLASIIVSRMRSAGSATNCIARGR